MIPSQIKEIMRVAGIDPKDVKSFEIVGGGSEDAKCAMKVQLKSEPEPVHFKITKGNVL